MGLTLGDVHLVAVEATEGFGPPGQTHGAHPPCSCILWARGRLLTHRHRPPQAAVNEHLQRLHCHTHTHRRTNTPRYRQTHTGKQEGTYRNTETKRARQHVSNPIILTMLLTVSRTQTPQAYELQLKQYFRVVIREGVLILEKKAWCISTIQSNVIRVNKECPVSR